VEIQPVVGPVKVPAGSDLVRHLHAVADKQDDMPDRHDRGPVTICSSGGRSQSRDGDADYDNRNGKKPEGPGMSHAVILPIAIED
jgi:hypothetical protein